ncbi:hypothetical protein Y032_0034g2834 [Ancylostoma ceylanicum]|uniref:Uncharacterized protein n=1 Tax=Ancylostoma ceylanicum TaxID=53326 RepID=A0A016UMM0_9BILA|nr:hypothetical protein Y032_0034g2834 [Ancylostoma ceylanicum]
MCYPIKTYPCKTRFTEGYLYRVDFHIITIHDLLLLHFVLTLAETPHLRQEIKMWMDELYWIAMWIKTNGNGYIPAMFSFPRSNMLDTAPVPISAYKFQPAIAGIRSPIGPPHAIPIDDLLFLA